RTARRDRHVVGIKQPGAGVAAGRGGIDLPLHVQAIVCRGFHPAAIATGCAAPRADAAVEIVALVAPHHDRATVAGLRGIGVQSCVGSDVADRCGLQAFATLPAAAHADAATALRAGSIDAAAHHADVLVGQQLHAAAVHADAVGVDYARVVDQVGEQVLRG